MKKIDLTIYDYDLFIELLKSSRCLVKDTDNIYGIEPLDEYSSIEYKVNLVCNSVFQYCYTDDLFSLIWREKIFEFYVECDGDV